MKIILEYPYNTKWKYGYVMNNKENRATLTLYNSHTERSCTQYARYLLSVKLGRFLTDKETVDHIDGDKTNNSIDNLQILSIGDNIRKSQKLGDIICICPICKKVFSRERKKVSGKIKKEKIKKGHLCCSRRCGGIFARRFYSPIT